MAEQFGTHEDAERTQAEHEQRKAPPGWLDALTRQGVEESLREALKEAFTVFDEDQVREIVDDEFDEAAEGDDD